MQEIIEWIPNISEGRDADKVEQIVAALKAIKGLYVLDHSSDADHHRTVLTLAGDRVALRQGALKLYELALEAIDLRSHQGAHPRMGAVDVCPFVPIRGISMADSVRFAKEVAMEIADRFRLPVFLYEEAATAPHRRNLADIRRGEFEGLNEKLQKPEWQPDFGPNSPHQSGGATVIGVRPFLVAYNINLHSSDLNIAKQIAKSVRGKDGGLTYVKAMGVELGDRQQVQVSMNLVNTEKTPIYRIFELVRAEARRWGVSIAGSEIVGLVPQSALLEAAAYYLQIENWDASLVLENRLMSSLNEGDVA